MRGEEHCSEVDPGLLLDGFEPRVPRSVQLEGAAFSTRGRVAISLATGRRVHAVIRAARPYDVNVAITDGGKVHVACDCVAFQSDASVCRHIWATLIKVQNDDLLRT